MPTSFPFLKIAREHNVPYGTVIRIAEEFWSATERYQDFMLFLGKATPLPVVQIIQAEVDLEKIRRAKERPLHPPHMLHGFDYFECPSCGFSSVQAESFDGSEYCPVCAGDCGHDVMMRRRPATDADRAEGFDARKGARDHQEREKLRKRGPDVA